MAGIYAIRDGGFVWWAWLLVTFGLILSHATNNLLNDYTDYVRGVDQDNYYRAQYGPQPLVHGLLTKRQLLDLRRGHRAVALAMGLALVFWRGGLTLPLLAAGVSSCCSTPGRSSTSPWASWRC